MESDDELDGKACISFTLVFNTFLLDLLWVHNNYTVYSYTYKKYIDNV